MYYQIDAIRWGPDGHLSHVRWHEVMADEEAVRHGPAKIVPVVDAASVCGSSEVRVYVEGSTGKFFRMKACPEGIDAEADERGTPLQKRLAHLPVF
ncbi:MAG TPA: hypothetical protein VFE82_05605 [Ramlibacter sp.]|jgi:hypothetical protein|uniref:hypothetical protein n=1 Tax=Ramlibacter sp. TaxID=1917967 RepID=UPI002D36CA89|nr:hypothetical protein [Ramlibacter sp.]HZY17937.1 hypothetical protein [Ramlibacter sp.]